MLTHIRSSAWSSRAALALSCSALLVVVSLTGSQKGPLKKLTYDASAEQFEMFEGLEAGVLEVKMIPKDSKGGNLYFENKTDKPITVKVPEAIVGVHILKQFGAGGGGLGGGGLGGGGLGGQQQGGGGQALGGGLGGGQQGGGFGGGGLGGGQQGGGGFFSIPPERIVQVPMQSVCLNHGKPEPRPRMTYQVRPLESHTTDPVLQELLKLYGTGRIDQGAAQAATWHLTDDMSWEELANKSIKHIGGSATPYFNLAQVRAAQQLVVMAEHKARTREKEENPRLKTTSQARP